MNRIMKASIFFVLFGMCITSMSCTKDDNPMAPSPFAGTWDLFTLTYAGKTVRPGEPFEIGGGIIVNATGDLVLTETRYTSTLTISGTNCRGLICPNPGIEMVTFTSNGTYSINGSTLHFTDEITGETDVILITPSVERLMWTRELTLSPEVPSFAFEVDLVFEKQ